MNEEAQLAEYNAAAAAIANELGAAADAAGAAAVEQPAEIVATSPVQAAEPGQSASPDIGKLLERLASLESALSQRQAETRQATREPEQPKQFAGDPYLDPEGALRHAGIDPDVFKRAVIAQTLGDQAPVELRAQAAVGGQMGALVKQLQALQGELSGVKRTLNQQNYQIELDDYVRGVDSTKYPEISQLAKSNPKWVTSAALDVVRADAAARRNDPTAAPLPPADAIARLAEKLSPIFTALKGSQTAAAPQPNVQTGQPTAPPPTGAALSGAPPVKVTRTFEEEVDSILKDVMRKHNIQ